MLLQLPVSFKMDTTFCLNKVCPMFSYGTLEGPYPRDFLYSQPCFLIKLSFSGFSGTLMVVYAPARKRILIG
jgi:hypothetical protein